MLVPGPHNEPSRFLEQEGVFPKATALKSLQLAAWNLWFGTIATVRFWVMISEMRTLAAVRDDDR